MDVVMKLGDYDTHPLADAFPLLEGDDFEAFKQSIKQCGMRQKSGVLFKGRILDGRNRYRAALELGLKFSWTTYEGDDPMGIVMALNWERRQLSIFARACVATKLATFTHGGSRRPKTARAGLTRDEAAKFVGLSEDTVARVKVILDKGIQELCDATQRELVDIKRAAEIAQLPETEQHEALAIALNKDRKKRPEPNGDPMATLLRAIMRAANAIGASVRTLPSAGGHALQIGYRGEAITLTLSSMKDAELVA
jgi:ParB-like chromosome segregation protein Spo0J